MLEIQEYLDAAGRSPFGRWFRKLDSTAAARVTTALARMEEGNLGDSKGVGGGVIERRIHVGPGYRVYFARDGGQLIILLGGGDKSTQPQDIKRARMRWQDYRLRQREG